MASETYSRHLIRMARRQADLTQQDLADLAGTSQAAISAYECPAAVPTPELDAAVRYAKYGLDDRVGRSMARKT